MNKSSLFFILISFFTYHSLQAQSVIEWKKDVKLNYENFKKKPIQTKVPQGFLDSKLGWQIAESTGELPELWVTNKFDESNSWLSMQHAEILKEMQLQFDLSEL